MAQSWGITLTTTVVLKATSPCSRQHCGGSVLQLGGGNSCLLCARPHGRDSAADLERELAWETGLAGLAKVALETKG